MKIGIVGCGLIGEKRAVSAKGHTIVALNDSNLDRSRSLSNKVGGSVVKHWKNVIEADVDVVIVATSHESLAEITLAAVEAKKHVLVEKPAGKTPEEIEQIIKASRNHGRIVKVGFNHRFHPSILKAKTLVEEGKTGPLLYIRGRYGHGGRKGMEKEWRCQPERSGGGELIDQGPHLIDLSRWFLGDLTLDYGIAPTLFWNIPVDDNCFLSLRSSSGQIAWLHATWVEWKNLFSFEIVGRDAKLAIDGLGGSYGTERLTFYQMSPQMGPPQTTIWEYPFPDTSWEKEFSNFEESIQKNLKPCGDIEDALAIMKIVHQVYGRSQK